METEAAAADRPSGRGSAPGTSATNAVSDAHSSIHDGPSSEGAAGAALDAPTQATVESRVADSSNSGNGAAPHEHVAETAIRGVVNVSRKRPAEDQITRSDVDDKETTKDSPSR
jgi:hypothetical protein